jgi:hypothetical protein
LFRLIRVSQANQEFHLLGRGAQIMLIVTTREQRIRRAAAADPPPTSDLDAAVAWLDRRADEIRQTQGVPLPEAQRLAWLELAAHIDRESTPC